MRVMTLNIWGAPYARQRAPRMRAIAQELAALHPDLIAFQEVYLPQDRALLISLLCDTWPHYRYFESGIIGSGLLTMSRYPILETQFRRFRLGGKQEDLRHGDYYAGKGIGLARIRTPDGDIVLYNTHTHAQYAVADDNEYRVFTEANLYEVTQFIRNTAHDLPVILCGDLNTRPEQMGYQIVAHLGALTDAYRAQHDQHPITFSGHNPYVADGDQTLDYVFTRYLTVQDARLVMNSPLPPAAGALAYSDHYGLMVTVESTPLKDPVSSDGTTQERLLTCLQQELTVLHAELEGERINHLAFAIISASGIVDARSLTTPLAHFPQLRRLLRRFVFALGISLALYQFFMAVMILRQRLEVVSALLAELEELQSAHPVSD